MTDQSVSERKRSAILDAARFVFARQGYAGTAVEEVAERAGIAKGTLYLYFKSKEELYLAALVEDLRELAANGNAGMAAAPTLRDKLRAFIRARVEYASTHEEFLRIYLAECGSMFLKSAFHNDMCNMGREDRRHLKGLIEAAVRSGEIAPVEAGAVAAAVFDLARGLIERRMLGWTELQPKDEIEFTVDLLWQGITGGRKASPKR